MERKIKNIFEFQRFSSNKKLEALIAQTQSRYTALNEDDLGFVNAAGAPENTNTERTEK